MRRHCPRCAAPAAIVVTSKLHETEIGNVDEQDWRCEECFYHFKLHSPIWSAFWFVVGIVALVAGIGVIAGFVETKPSERTLLAMITLGAAIASIVYAGLEARRRKRATPVDTAR